MTTLRLSPHLDARYGSTPNEVLFSNLCFGTRIVAESDSWEKLRAFGQSQEMPDDPWLKRALGALIIESPDARPYPDFVLRLEAALKSYLELASGERVETTCDKAGLLALLERAESVFRGRDMPVPYTGSHPMVGAFLRQPHRLVDFMFDHTRAFISHDLEMNGGDSGLDFALVEQFFDRPAMKHRYEQQFCIPLTTQRRAELIVATTKPGSRVLVLGDDDLVSLALLHLTHDLQIDVLELDEDLVSFLHDKGGERLTVLEHNLRYGVPDSMRNVYHCVTTDPPYAEEGMRFFLGCARDSLAEGPDSRLLLTTYPGLLQAPDCLMKDIANLGLEVRKTHEYFSRYIYNNVYRVEQLTVVRHLGAPLHPTAELLGFPYLYAHFFECAHKGGGA